MLYYSLFVLAASLPGLPVVTPEMLPAMEQTVVHCTSCLPSASTIRKEIVYRRIPGVSRHETNNMIEKLSANVKQSKNQLEHLQKQQFLVSKLDRSDPNFKQEVLDESLQHIREDQKKWNEFLRKSKDGLGALKRTSRKEIRNENVDLGQTKYKVGEDILASTMKDMKMEIPK